MVKQRKCTGNIILVRAVPSCDADYWAYKVVLTFESVDETFQMEATEQYFLVVLFIMLYKVVLTFESVDKTLTCGHSNESY